LPEIEQVTGEEMPEQFRQLLVHQHDMTPTLEKYLVDQAKDLVAGAGEGRINAMPDVAKALNRDLLARAKAAR